MMMMMIMMVIKVIPFLAPPLFFSGSVLIAVFFGMSHVIMKSQKP
jgi:hypothetical protein